MSRKYQAALLLDFYKVSHREQYPDGTHFVYSNWTARGTRLAGVDHVVAFGFQAFIQRYLIDYFNENFFDRPKEDVIAEYARYIKYTLGIADPYTKHLEDLHDLGYLPLEIKAVPEGTLVPVRVPMLTIENTDPRFFWLTNYIETLFSVESWMPSTSATIAWEYRKLLTKWAKETGSNLEGVAFQGHDFSMRGMSSVESAAASGAGHLLSFTGTDTVPAIMFHEFFYGANIENELVGASIPATEHSVMCAYGPEDERGTFKHIVKDKYPGGFVSIVSDTWDLWRVLEDYLPSMKAEILERDGRVVIRPDSGDPVDIICGIYQPHHADYAKRHPGAEEGVIEMLWDTFGGTVNDKGFKELDPHVGSIYGDSITLERADTICKRLAAKGFASGNIVFGIGSFTYQYQTRDTFMFALKSTWVEVNGEERQIFKNPATDDGIKKSLKGRTVVMEDLNGELYVKDGLDLSTQQGMALADLFRTIFLNGSAQNFQTLAEIRGRLLSHLE